MTTSEEVFVLDDLKMSELMCSRVREHLQKKERRGVVITPNMKMVKRKTDSYKLLPDHRLL